MLDASARQGILKPIRLVIVDRQPMVLQGLKSVLGTQQDFDVVASSSDGTSCLEAIRKLTPDVALVGDALPDLTAKEILAIAGAEKLSTRLVFFTESDAGLTAAIAAGTCSAISKYAAPGTMLRSLRLMAKSGVSLQQRDLSPVENAAEDGKIEKMLALLTDRERQIARLVSEGMSNKEIARELNVSQGTVKVHLYNIFQKLEITNRTVLATIALLQRTSALGALALAFLAFAIADELKASEASDIWPDDSDIGQAGEHPVYEAWKKAILQRFIRSQSDATQAPSDEDFFAKASQVANPAAAMEALRAAEQFIASKPWKDVHPAGSISPHPPGLSLRGINDAPTGDEPAPKHQFSPLASGAISPQAGYGAFAAVAGALIFALQDPDHAKAHELDHGSLNTLLAIGGENASTTLAAIDHGAGDLGGNSAADLLPDDAGRHSGPVMAASDIAHQGVRGQTGPDAADHNVQKPVGLLDTDHDAGPPELGRDQLTGGNAEHVVNHSPIESRSNSSELVLDFTSHPGRLNLAAFGALAWLHLTAAPKTIPPHTLIWFYDPERNETIVYVNSTDRVLDVGDRSLVEVHLQGIVSVAEADFAQQSDGAVHAVTLEQLEQALMPASTDEIAVSASSHASEDPLGTADVWSALADDGFSFQFAAVRMGSGTAAKSGAVTSGSVDETEESAAPSGVSAYGSSTPPGHSAATPAAENFSAKNEPMNANAGVPSTKQNDMAQPGFGTTNGVGGGNSEHPAAPGAAKAEMAQADPEPGNGVGRGNEQHSQATDDPPKAAKTTGPDAEHGNPGHSTSAQDPKAAEIAEPSVAPADKAGRGHSQHGAEPGSAKAADAEITEAKSKPGKGVGQDHEQHSQALDTPRGAEKSAESGGIEHGHSAHSASAKGAEAGKSGTGPDETEDGHSQRPAEPGSAKAGAAEMAEAKSKPGNGTGNDHEHHSKGPDGPPGAAKTPESGGAEHGHSGHSASAKAAEAAEGDAKAGDKEHGHSQHAAEPGSAKAGATEIAEAKPKSGDGVGNDKEHPQDGWPEAVKTADPSGAEHGNPGHSSSAKVADAGASIATANADHGNSQRDAHSVARAPQSAQPAKAAPELGGSDQVFRFDGGAASSTLITVVEPHEVHTPHAAINQEDDLGTRVKVIPHALDEHGAHDGHHGPHPATLSSHHDLLI